MKRSQRSLRALCMVTGLVSGCAQHPPLPNGGYTQVHPEWAPAQGVEWAIADCDAKAAQTNGYDWIDAALKKGEAKATCMKAYGFEK